MADRRPIRPTAKQMARAAELAARLGLSVRLEPDGSVTFAPAKDDPAPKVDERPKVVL